MEVSQFKRGQNIITSATIEPTRDGYRAYLWGEYGRSSVLAGQTLRQWFAEASTVAHLRAQLDAQYPGIQIEQMDHPTMKPHISVAHLPGEDDPVPGGSLPDDIGEWPPLP